MGFQGTFIKFLFVVVVISLSPANYEATEGKSISIEEDIELERQLKILNKPPIKTIHAEWGDIVDCIDIHKQPAFHHPSLKNHKIQLKPSSSPKRLITEKTSSVTEPKTANIRSEGIECPEGTVPIRRTTKEDLIRAKSLSRRTNSTIKNNQDEHGVVLKLQNGYQKFYGANALISTYNPFVNEDEFSTAQLWIASGPNDQVNNIQAGWTVSPPLYRDHHTRFFTYWTSDGFHKTGCYNTLCPGFVQVHKSIYPSSPIKDVSTYGGDQHAIRVYVYQDRRKGDWWLTTVDNIMIGYWPKSIFNRLGSGGADAIYWGGMTKAGGACRISPAMGSGHFPDGVYTHAAFFDYIQYVNGFNQLVDPKTLKMEIFTDCVFYNLTYNGYQDPVGNNFYFGGPGGRCP